MTSRFFSRDKLEELDVPDTNLHDEQHDTRRWSEARRCIFRAPDDGKTYRVAYQVPLTEHQECDLWFDEQQIEAFQVEELPVVVQQWHPVDSSLARLHTAAKVANEGAPHVAMQAVKRVYELCREHDARTGLVPVAEVLNALGVSSDGEGLDELAPE